MTVTTDTAPRPTLVQPAIASWPPPELLPTPALRKLRDEWLAMRNRHRTAVESLSALWVLTPDSRGDLIDVLAAEAEQLDRREAAKALRAGASSPGTPAMDALRAKRDAALADERAVAGALVEVEADVIAAVAAVVDKGGPQDRVVAAAAAIDQACDALEAATADMALAVSARDWLRAAANATAGIGNSHTTFTGPRPLDIRPESLERIGAPGTGVKFNLRELTATLRTVVAHEAERLTY